MGKCKLKNTKLLSFKVIVRLIYMMVWLISLFLFIFSKNPIVVHYDELGNVALGDKLHLFIGAVITAILGECLIKRSINVRIQTNMQDFPCLTTSEGRYLAGVIIVAVVFIGLMFDQVGMTRIFY